MPYKRKNSPYWYISYRDTSGARVTESSGTKDHREAKALESARRLETHQAEKWGKEPERTFDEVIVAYLDSHKTDRVLHGIKPLYRFFGGKQMGNIRGADIRGYIYTRQQENIAVPTITRELRIFSAACNWCSRHLDWPITNPVSGRTPGESEGRIRWITKAESVALIEAARQSKEAPYLADFVVIGLNTGMRKNEILGLEWRRVDLQNGLIYLDPKDQKGRRRSSVPINQDTRSALISRLRWRAEHCPGTIYVFAREDGERIGDIKRSFATACRRAGIADFHPHDLRHTLASWLVQAGTPIIEVAELLRHRDIRTTMRYAHLAPGNVARALERLYEQRI